MRVLFLSAAILTGCGGGAYEISVATSATEEDVLKCGIGAYFVPPVDPSLGRGHCVAYPQVPAASAASAP